MPQTVKTRFAPSPTGYLHVGGARTALFNYLFAKHHKGQFTLRIEDTDQQRSTQEATDAILDGLKWLGLDWDEPPIYQSQRTDHYNQRIDELLSQGKAYYCDCSVEVLDKKRQLAMSEGRKPKYDGLCRLRGLGAGDNRVVRFKAPLEGETVVDDLIKGKVVYPNSELDDLIIRRADGSPTYNFVVVIDDMDAGMTHILRGDDHLNNTPKQLLIYAAFDAKPPLMGHLPMILGQDKSRLSKRHGATAVQAYRDEGYLPEAMNNFLVRLGWSHGDQEIFSVNELIELFSLKSVGKSPSVFNQEKLMWLNHHYLRQKTPDELTAAMTNLFGNEAKERLASPQWPILLQELMERCKTLKEYATNAAYFFSDSIKYDADAAAKFLTPELEPALNRLCQKLVELKDFSTEQIEIVFKSVLEEADIKMKPLAQAVRVALTGNTFSPGIYLLVHIVDQKRSAQRLKEAITFIGDKK